MGAEVAVCPPLVPGKNGKGGRKAGPPDDASGAGAIASRNGVGLSFQMGGGGGRSTVSTVVRGKTGALSTGSGGSPLEVGSVWTSDIRFPHRARTRCLPSVNNVSPACSVTFFLVQ